MGSFALKSVSSAHFERKTHLESCRQSGLTSAQFHRQQMPVTATCGRRTDGASRQSVPVFQTQEVDTEEDEIEKKMDEGGKEEENKLHHSRKLPFGPLLSRYHCIADTKYIILYSTFIVSTLRSLRNDDLKTGKNENERKLNNFLCWK